MHLVDLRPVRDRQGDICPPYFQRRQADDGWAIASAREGTTLVLRIERPDAEPVVIYEIITSSPAAPKDLDDLVGRLFGYPLSALLTTPLLTRPGLLAQPAWTCVRTLYEAAVRTARQQSDWPRPASLERSRQNLVWAAHGFTPQAKDKWAGPQLDMLLGYDLLRSVNVAYQYAHAGFSGIAEAARWIRKASFLDATDARAFAKAGWTPDQVDELHAACRDQQTVLLGWQVLPAEQGIAAARAGLAPKEAIRLYRSKRLDMNALASLAALRTPTAASTGSGS